MNNNEIFKKLRVALQLRDDQIVDILKLANFRISKSELGAFFRKEDHPKYVECGDQVLRNFLNGLVIHLRGTKENPKDPKATLDGIKAEIRQPAKGIPPKTTVAKKPAPKQPAKGAKKAKPTPVVEKVRSKNGKTKGE